MILLFCITDSLGRRHRCSLVCGPATTAVGAANQLRQKLSIPADVDVQLRLANDVPIRHITAPLTSLRKQRSGSAQVLRIQLWAVLSGTEAAVQQVNYAPAEVVKDGDDDHNETEDGEWDDSSHSASLPSSRRHSSATTPQTARVVISGPPAKAMPVPVQAKVPLTARTHLAPPTTTSSTTPRCASEQIHDSLSASEAKKSTCTTPTPTPALTSPEPATPRVIKRRSMLEASLADSALAAGAMPLTARGPVRRLPVEATRDIFDVPQTARGAPQQVAGARRAEGLGALYKTGYARRDAAVAQIMLREYPKLVVREPREVVLAVRGDGRLSSCSYNRDFTAASDLDGFEDAAYAQWLSVGLTHALDLRTAATATTAATTEATSAHKEPQLALYAELSTIRHSCCPNAAVQYDLFSAPYAGSCRCALLDGIARGQEITYLYKHADSLAFLLLSRDRRRNLLRRRYFMECTCARCSETLENTIPAPDADSAGASNAATPDAAGAIVKKRRASKPQAEKIGTRTKAQLEAEATLTGAFFTHSSVDRDAARQKALSLQMHHDFEALQLMDDTGVEINLTLAGNVPPLHRTKQCNRLLGFLRKYGSSESVLRLHDHHWRLNLVRAAYVQETVRLCAVKGATPDARHRDPESTAIFTPTKTVYDVCLKQLAAEAVFIPAGHPHSLTTYESYLYLVAILPPALAESAARSAKTASTIKWKQLEETKAAWGVLKRTALPPNIQRIVQSTESAHSSENATAPPPPTPRPHLNHDDMPVRRTTLKAPPTSRKNGGG